MCNPKVSKHLEITKELAELYERKNRDYGDSFAKSYEEWGLIIVCMRLGDKLERLKKFAKTGEFSVDDETVEDTLVDLANYAIMALIERRLEGEL